MSNKRKLPQEVENAIALLTSYVKDDAQKIFSSAFPNNPETCKENVDAVTDKFNGQLNSLIRKYVNVEKAREIALHYHRQLAEIANEKVD